MDPFATMLAHGAWCPDSCSSFTAGCTINTAGATFLMKSRVQPRAVHPNKDKIPLKEKQGYYLAFTGSFKLFVLCIKSPNRLSTRASAA